MIEFLADVGRSILWTALIIVVLLIIITSRADKE